MVLDFQLKTHERYLAGFNRLFSRIDADKDGLINRAEFERLLSDLQIGLDPEEIQAMYTKLRDDG